jgi:hypothetical protein
MIGIINNRCLFNTKKKCGVYKESTITPIFGIKECTKIQTIAPCTSSKHWKKEKPIENMIASVSE